MQSSTIEKLNTALDELENKRDIRGGIETAQILLGHLGIHGQIKTDETIMSYLKLPNAERYDTWFQTHPHFPSSRACFKLNDPSEGLVEAKLYALNKKSKLFISGSVHFSPNYEDAEFTRNNPKMKIGIDFFLTPDNSSLLVVLSKDKFLRVVELKGKLTNTQVEIFSQWEDAATLSKKETIHTLLWDSFKLKSINKKFYTGIANSFKDLVSHLEENGKNSNDARIFANRLHGRLLFCWFLDKKDFINKEMKYFDLEGLASDEYYTNKLEPLFFDTLNTEQGDERKQKNNFDQKTPYLNGGLFEDQDTDWREEGRSFPAGFFTRLYDHFNEFNFTTDESTTEYEQIAIDPEMLGKIFENLLAEINVNDETNEQARKAKGAFYTPREIVSYMCVESIREFLHTSTGANEKQKTEINTLLDTSDADWAKSGTNSRRDAMPKEFREKVIAALDDLKVLDPACGSGAYPMGILHLMLRLYERLEGRFDVYKTKLKIMENNIYGVDIEPLAIEISRIRSFLALVVDQDYIEKKPNGGIDTLPNLEFKFVCADTLTPLVDAALDEGGRYTEMLELKKQYFKATPKQREKIEDKYEKLRTQGSMFNADLSAQLATYEPFSNNSSASFYDQRLMHDIQDAFDLTIGNPPYVQLQKNQGALANKYQDIKYKTFARTGDLYVLFYERGLALTKSDTGLLCYITSNKWMRAGYGKKLRSYFLQNQPILLLDFGGFKVFESATVDTNILLIRNNSAELDLKACHFKNDFKPSDDIKSYLAERSEQLTSLTDEAWFIGNTLERSLKEKIEAAGTSLKDMDVEINYGIKTGCNEAFVIDTETKDRLIAEDPKSAEIIKSMLRGKDIQRYAYDWKDVWLITTGYGLDIEHKYPAVFKYLKSVGDDIEAGKIKSKGKGLYKRDDQGKNWWNLRACDYYEEFEKEKIMWTDIAKEPSFVLVPQGVYANNTIYMINTEQARYITAILNSSIVKFYLPLTATDLGGGGNRYFKQFVELCPIPDAEKQVRDQLSQFVDIIQEKKTNDTEADTLVLEKEIDELVMDLYNLTEEEKEIIRNS